MNFNSKTVYEVLTSKGIQYLYHANSVVTSCQFIRNGHLMSRGSVERKGFVQTSQTSDAIDKRNNLWFDVFMDTVDIHGRAKNVNFYGPVLFVLNIDLLNQIRNRGIWVTKINPTKWAGKSKEEKWFSNKADLTGNFVYGRFDQMIVVRNSGGEISIEDFIEKIVLDDPGFYKMPGEIDYFSMAVGALRYAMEDSGLDIPIERRKCSPTCSCGKYWDRNRFKLSKMFDPKQS